MDMDALWQAETVYRSDLFLGKTVLVSGAGSGIGRATALLLGRLGARVVLTGRTLEKLQATQAFLAAKGGAAVAITCNIREAEQVDALFAQIETEIGTIHGLISSAGGQFPQAAIDYSAKGWAAVVNNNLNGSWYMMQRAAQHWRADQKPGSIVNIVVVTDRGMPGVAHTCAARAGVIAASRTVAVEWAPLNIRVNCVAPGLTATEGLAVYPPEAVKEFPRANPMKRPGTAMEIAEACVYLTAESGSFITGEVLTVDGGGKLWGELWTAGRPEYFS